MRLKTLGVVLITALAAFTMLYWVTDDSRRESVAVAQEDELLEFGEVIFSDNPAEPASVGCARCHGADGTIHMKPEVFFLTNIRQCVEIVNRPRIDRSGAANHTDGSIARDTVRRNGFLQRLDVDRVILVHGNLSQVLAADTQ